ncbi:hypothetical protein CSB45_03210 [candidate division KSB3 bacterium]|uniref:Uncharacterized protein n=1 Tax=candidate division KSB3 bacterium TaxID=2044937 RepID=A0A2G6E8Y8_9BACT|nr:MAG: hypothetical protein CSB45_03210 [candidate division KSB3 bacterium]
MMKNISQHVLLIAISLCSIYALRTIPLAAQETSESLQLPEVVITGTDQSKIQRDIPGIPASQTTVSFIDSAKRDDSDKLVAEGKLLAFVHPEKAEKAYIEALKHDPGNCEAYLRLADVLRTQGREETAARVYEQAVNISTNTDDTLEAHYQLGILYESRLNDVAQAITHYRAYLDAGGDDTRVAVWLKTLERREQQPSEQMTAP